MFEHKTQSGVIKEKVEATGTMVKALSNTTVWVKLENGQEVSAHTCGRMRKHYMRTLTGNRRLAEVSRHCLLRTRVVYCRKNPFEVRAPQRA
jgi:translation initiation factor IF-1